jgi:hypothetical protein
MSKARDIASAAPAPSTVSATEIGYLDGVTSAIQTQINTKQATVSGVDDTEIGYLNGVTSAIQTQLDGKVAASIVDAKGDIIAASASDTVARLAVGSNDTVLTADSSTATGLKWATPAAGGMTLLSTTSLTGASVTISSIPTTYNDLYVLIDNPYLNTAGTYLSVQPNSATNLADFRYSTWTSSSAGNFGVTAGSIEAAIDLAGTTDVTRNVWILKIYSYANTTYGKPFEMVGTSSNANSAIILSGGIRTASAITSLKITTTAPGSRTFSGGQVRIYGVK